MGAFFMNTTFFKAALLIVLNIIIAVLPNIVLADCTNNNTNTNTPVAAPAVYSTDIYLSELLPNPSTDEASGEFIELYNADSAAVDLSGWSLSDATDKTYTLSGSIAAKSYLAVYRSDSDIALNNTGDTAELYNPNNILQDSIEYTDSADDDVSYALTKTGDWAWTTTPTPNKANTITAVIVAPTNTTTQPDTKKDSTPSVTYDLSNKIQLSELLPDPAGSDATDEWIELYNGDSRNVDLTGWQIVDSSHAFTIKDVTINKSDYALFAVADTGISLNNGGETVQLVDPTGTEIDSITYSTAITGESYARTSSAWAWTTTLTPNASNAITLPATDTQTSATGDSGSSSTSTTSNSSSSATDATSPTGLLTIAVAKQQDSSTKVVVQGVVSVLPGVFSTSYLYIQDASSGVQVYSSNKAFPALAVGDTVQVTGTIGTANGEIKINTSSTDDISIINSGNAIAPLPVTSYVVDNAGQVVQVAGVIAGKSGSTITLDSGWTIYVKRGTGISTSSFVVGTNVTVAGVLVSTTDGVQVWPRSPVDITTVTTTSGTAAGSTTSTADGATVSGILDKTNTDASQRPASNQTFSLPVVQQAAMSLGVLGWFCIAAGLGLGITLLFRSERLRNLVRNWISVRAHGWVKESDHSVVSEKNTTDLNAPTQYHELHLLNKTLS